MTRIVNAENKILGRFASKIARMVRDGEDVKIVNSEKAVISGTEEDVKSEYRQKYERGAKYRGPHFPKAPHNILKRTVRGMLPNKEKRGREQHSRVKTYIEVPADLEDFEEVDVKEGDDLKSRNYVKLGEVSKSIGWSKRGEN